MSIVITPGRWRGLKTTSLAQSDIFGIVAFDQRGSYRRMMPDNTPYDTLVKIKTEVVTALARYASAVLLDPTYGLTPAMHMSGQAGLLFALEKSGYSGESTYRKPEFLDSWTPEKIRKSGANAVKLLVYYNPQASELADELDGLIAGIVAKCHAQDLPVFLEPMSYSVEADVSKDSAAFAGKKAEIVVETARRLSRSGADVLKLEFPVDPNYTADQQEWRKQCEAISAVCAVPWVLLSAGVDYAMFEKQLIIACEAGASGFLAGRAIWKEGTTMPPDERATFLETTATERLKKLLSIAAEKSRPWSEFYRVRESTGAWYEAYA